jgi:hypothetical protein
MAMRRYDARKRALASERTIEVAANIKTRKRFEQDFLNRITVAFEFAEHLRIERPLFRHRQQTGTGEDLLSQKDRALLPRLARHKNRHFVVSAG